LLLFLWNSKEKEEDTSVRAAASALVTTISANAHQTPADIAAIIQRWRLDPLPH
jgi:hypothetical protein